MTQFTGKNAPNYAMNAPAVLSTWTAENGATAYPGPGILITNSSEYNASYLQVFNTSNTASGKARANLGTGSNAGLNNFTDGQEYIQIIGYENSGKANSIANITYYLFTVSNGRATLSSSFQSEGNTYSFSPSGQYVVLYGNIVSTGLTTNPDRVTFQYAKPASTLTGLLKGVNDYYAYKDDIVTALNIEDDVNEKVETYTLKNTATLNKIQATNGITAEGTTNDYVSFDMGKGGNVWIMTQFTGKNAPNYAMNATGGLSTWTSSNATTTCDAAGVLITNSSEYNASYLQVFNTSNTASGKARANLGTGTNAGLKNFTDGQEYIQIIGYEDSGNGSTANITYYLFTVSGGTATLSSSFVRSSGNTYSFSTYGQYVVLYGNIESTALTPNPGSVTFQYAKPASTLKGMLKGVNDYYAYKDDIVTALGIEDDVSEKIETSVLNNTATLNKIQATNGITAEGTTNDYVSFNMGAKGGNVWIMTQFTGKNAPNYAMNAPAVLSTWTAENGATAYPGPGILITNSSEYNASYLQVFNTSNTASGKARANLGTGSNAGLNNFTDGQEYIQIIGYENSGKANSIANITYYLFTVSNGRATLSSSFQSEGNTYSFSPSGQYVVLYGNIVSTGLTTNPDRVTFSYQAPRTTLSDLVNSVSSDYAYKDDIINALSVSAVGKTTLNDSITLNKIQATNGITAEGTTNDYVSFDMGVKGGNVWIMTQFTGKNAPNYAMNAAANGLSTWTTGNNATVDRNAAGVLITNSSEYNASYLQVFRNSNTASGKATANLDDGTYRAAGLNNLTDGQEYIQIIGYENSGNNTTANITYYLFTVSGGSATLSKSFVQSSGGSLSFTPYGQYVVLYGNIVSTGLTANPECVTFSYHTPKTTLSELVNSLSSDYAFKDDIMSALSIASVNFSVVFKDMEGNTLKTRGIAEGNVVSLPNSTLADFVGWYNETDGKLYKSGDVLSVKANMTFVEAAAGIALVDGASVRLKNDMDGLGGLRFETVVSKAIFQLLGDNVVFSGAIIPTDLLSGEFTLETERIKSTEFVNKIEIDNAYHAYITLTNIKQSNFDREFSARAFVTVTYADGTTASIGSAYDEAKNSRSVYYVATMAYNSGAYNGNAVLKHYLDNAVNVAFRADGGEYDVVTSHDYDGLPSSYNRAYTVEHVNVSGSTVTFDVVLSDDTYNGSLSVKFWGNANTFEKKTVAFVNGRASVSFDWDSFPNYQVSNGEFTYWAYSATCGDYYQVNGTKYYQDASGNQLAATEENESRNVLKATDADSLELYADAGFNVLFINWGATAYSATDGNYTTYFDTSEAKRIMDIAAERDIKCFVYSTALCSLSESHTSLIVGAGNGNNVTTFDTQAKLNTYVAKILYGIKDHPAFYGVSLVDEPYYTQFDAIGEIYQAVQAAAPGAFCNINLNPLLCDSRAVVRYNGSSISSPTAAQAEAAYMEYLDSYYEKVGRYCGYIGYDSYPMLQITGQDFLSTYIRNAQIVADFCKEHDLRFGLVCQTHKSDSTGRRAVNADDIEWQLNFGMAMGVKDYSYYTYYPVLNSTTLPDEDYTFVNRAGETNATYDTVKDMHTNMQVMAKALTNFEYVGMKYYTRGSVDTSMRNALSLVDNSHSFNSKLTGVTLSNRGVAIVTELYDEANGRFGYFVMNATNPNVSVANQTITLNFAGYSNVQIYKNGTVSNYALTNGVRTITLAEAEGAFLIPY